MNPDDEQIIAVVREFLTERGIDASHLNPQTRLEEFGVESLQLIDLLFKFEEQFGIVVPLEHFNAATVADAVAYVHKVLVAQHTDVRGHSI